MGLRNQHDITDIYGVRGERQARWQTSDAPETGLRHSDAYHKYFRGYTELRRVDEKGRVRVERYYTRPWIVSGLSGGRYWLLRLLYALLTASSAALFIWALCRRVPGTSSWIAALPGFGGALALFLLAASVLAYIFAERRMTLWGHASSTKRLKVLSLVTACAQLLTALALAGVGLYAGEQVVDSLICAGLLCLAAGCSAALFFLERRVPYGEIPNDTVIPPGETEEIW